MFLFTKILSQFFFPVLLCLGVLLLGVIRLWFAPGKRAGRIVVTFGFILFALLSYQALPEALLRPLESRYPPLLSVDHIPDVKWVVVLGGGHVSDSSLPVTCQIDSSALARLTEGIRLYNLLPESRLLLSGGIVFDPVSNAEIMADVAVALNVDKKDLVLEVSSRDTKDEAHFIRKIVGSDKFIMVTSASHMVRSMALFRKQGMEPVPAPADFWIKEDHGISPGVFFPSSDGLKKAERAVYEYLGLAWGRIRGQL